MQLATICGCHRSIIKFTAKNFLIRKFLCFIKYVWRILSACDQQLPATLCINAKVLHAAQDSVNPSLVSRLCCEEKASYDVSPVYSFAASQGLAYEKRDES